MVGDCVFDCERESEGVRELLARVLIGAGVPVVRVRPCVLHALGPFSLRELETVHPRLVRQMLRDNPVVCGTEDRASRLMLLMYVLKDEDFRDLAGIELLPLANGRFMRFLDRRGEKGRVYLPTSELCANLLPTLEGCLVSGDLDAALRVKVEKLARKGI